MTTDTALQLRQSNAVSTRQLGHWTEFLNVVNERHSNSPAYIYRGQAHNWPLMSSLDRLECRFPRKRDFVSQSSFKKSEPRYFECPPVGREAHLQAFKDASRGRAAESMAHACDDEWWSLARHHGLATPILDWTLYPFVALYFAFEDERIRIDDAFIEPTTRYVYRVSWHLINNGAKGADHPRVHLPAQAGTARMVSQGGVSVFMPFLGYEHFDLEDYVRKSFRDEEDSVRPHLGSVLEIIEIPSIDRTDCLKFLNKAAINRMTMYPDLDGSAAYINALWELDFDTSLGHFKYKSKPTRIVPDVKESPTP